MNRLAAWIGVLALVLLAGPVAGQGAPTIVRGVIRDTAGAPIEGVEVSVVGVREIRRVQTSATGGFRVVLYDGPRFLALVARRIGYRSVTWSVSRTDEDVTVETDATLVPTLVQLPDIVAEAPRVGGVQRPLPPVGGLTNTLRLERQWLGIGAQGDLDRLWESLGMGLTRDSLDRMGGGQSVTMGGLPLDANLVPPDALGGARLVTTSSDVSQGGLGTELALQPARGGLTFTGRVRGIGSSRHLAWSDPRSSIRPNSTLTSTGFLSGPLRVGESYYHASWVVRESWRPISSLLSGATDATAHVSGDTVAALRSALSDLGVSLGGVSDQRIRQAGLVLTGEAQPSAATRLTVTLAPTWTSLRSGGQGLAMPSMGSTGGSASHRITGLLEGMLAEFVSQTQVSLQSSRSWNEPLVAQAQGAVQVGTSEGNEPTGVTSVAFGSLGARAERWSTRWQVRHTGVRSEGAHRISLGWALDWVREGVRARDGWSSYQYPSLDALVNNAPSLSRWTPGQGAESAEWRTVSGWLSDGWRIGPGFGVEAGLRLDAARVLGTRMFNPRVAAEVGERTDRVPSSTAFSPRAGFVWRLGDARPDPNAGLSRAPGTNIVRRVIGIGSFGSGLDGMIRQTGGGYRLYGSVGRYVGELVPRGMSSRLAATGLERPRPQVCVGDAVLHPDWSTGGTAAAAECADGELTGVTAPALVFAPGYQPASQWKVSLGLSGLSAGVWTIRPSAHASWSAHGVSQEALHLRQNPAFTLADEGGRPVYVPASAIVPGSGLHLPGSNRLDPAQSEVTRLRSDLRARQVTLGMGLHTEKALGSFPLVIEYQFRSGVSERWEGVGAQASRTWGPDGGERHQVAVGTFGYRVWWFELGGMLRVWSGGAFAPVVGGDVDGDGRSGDRAFIPVVSATTSGTFAAEYRALQERLPTRLQRCLARQAGQVAFVGSCPGPWQSHLELQLQFKPPPTIPLSTRISLETRLSGTMGAIARLVGLGGTGLGRVPSSSMIDNRLLLVTGFDPATRTYIYRVNPGFGQAQVGRVGAREPFQVELGASYQLAGRAVTAYSAIQQIIGSSGPMPPLDVVRERLRRDNLLGPAEQVLARAEELSLTPAQRQALVAIDSTFRSRTDPLLTPLMNLVQTDGRAVPDAAYYQAANAVLFLSETPRITALREVEAVLTSAQQVILRQRR